MTKNDVLRRVRYTFDYNDAQMIDIFKLADLTVTRNDVSCWLKKDDAEGFIELPDVTLAVFLNGLINTNRGKKEGVQPEPEKRLSNNAILRKLKIALNLKEEDMMELYELAEMRISKHELSAFFRNPSQSQYRLCKDQFLRNFLRGMQIKYHTTTKD